MLPAAVLCSSWPGSSCVQRASSLVRLNLLLMQGYKAVRCDCVPYLFASIECWPFQQQIRQGQKEEQRRRYKLPDVLFRSQQGDIEAF